MSKCAFDLRLRVAGALCWVAFPAVLSAQGIDIGLYPTAVPDSFEVRMVSPGGYHTGVLRFTFTLRWESSAGGTLDNNDIASGCAQYHLANFGGVVEAAGYRYAAINQLEELVDDACAINGTPRAIAGIRIRGLHGCRHVRIVTDAFTDQNNLSYWVSVWGSDHTGQILTAPLASGTCGPCDPPQITSITAMPAAFCDVGQVNLSATSTPGSVIHWYAPYPDNWIGSGVMAGYGPTVDLVEGVQGTYTAVALNACGSDTASAAVLYEDPDCLPPVIMGLSYEGDCYSDNFGLSATVVDAGSCPLYMWYGNGSNHISPYPQATFLAQEGTYGLQVTNSCGTDTMFISLDSAECVAPVITGITYEAPECMPMILTAAVANVGPCYEDITEWRFPDGAMYLYQGMNMTVNGPQSGYYRFRYTNECGTDVDSVLVEPVPGCIPPQIISITHNGPICAGDTLHLMAEVLNAEACVTYSWYNGPGGTGDGLTFIAPDSHYGSVQFYVANACGSADTSFHVPVVAASGGSISICAHADPYALYWALADHVPGGVWMHNGVEHDSLYAPALDDPGVFEYLDPSSAGCPAVPVTVVENPSYYNGIGDSITLCSTDEPVDLFSFLGGSPDAGGTFSHGMDGALPGGIYDPAIDHGGAYSYSHGYCSYPLTYLIVTELHPGSPCDDGNAGTVNDTLDYTCTCVGELPLGIAQQAQSTSAFELWPNPSTGGPWTVAADDFGQMDGTASFQLFNALGEPIFTRVLKVQGRALRATVDPGMRLAPGLYLARLQAGTHTFVQRLVIR